MTKLDYLIKEDENGIKRVKNWIIPKHCLPCMIREDLYREIVEKDADFFDKDRGSLPLAIGSYLCEKMVLIKWFARNTKGRLNIRSKPNEVLDKMERDARFVCLGIETGDGFYSE